MKFAIFSILVTFALKANSQETPVQTIHTETLNPIVAPAAEEPLRVTTLAQNPIFKIKQIIQTYQLVVVESNEPTSSVSVGKVFLATYPDGKQCTLITKESSGNLVTLDSSGCEPASLSTNLPIEPALVEPARFAKNKLQEESAPPLPTGLRFGGNLYYSNAEDLQFNDGFATTSSGSGYITTTIRAAGAWGYGLHLTSSSPHTWGYSVLLSYESSREARSVTFTGPGGSASGFYSGTKPKLSLLFTEVQFQYRWQTFYTTFGINSSAPFISGITNSYVEIRGRIGAILGVGLYVYENIALEFLVRSIGFKMTETSGTTSVDYGNGTLTGATVGLKHHF